MAVIPLSFKNDSVTIMETTRTCLEFSEKLKSNDHLNFHLLNKIAQLIHLRWAGGEQFLDLDETHAGCVSWPRREIRQAELMTETTVSSSAKETKYLEKVGSVQCCESNSRTDIIQNGPELNCIFEGERTSKVKKCGHLYVGTERTTSLQN